MYCFLVWVADLWLTNCEIVYCHKYLSGCMLHIKKIVEREQNSIYFKTGNILISRIKVDKLNAITKKYMVTKIEDLVGLPIPIFKQMDNYYEIVKGTNTFFISFSIDIQFKNAKRNGIIISDGTKSIFKLNKRSSIDKLWHDLKVI